MTGSARIAPCSEKSPIRHPISKIANEAKEIRFNAGKKLTEAKSNYDNQRIAAQEGLKYCDSVAKILEKANTFDIKINDKEFVSFELTTERKAEVQKLVEEVGINSKIKKLIN